MIGSAKILIVDDFATMRKMLKSFLNKLGYTDITEAENAKIAWELIQKEPFDLVISDFNMPEMNGLELLTKIRKESHNPKQKFLMLSAETDTSLLIETKSLDINGYILKPYKLEALEAKLNSIFTNN
jgi:two-component system chemotaxis response regulator CheY